MFDKRRPPPRDAGEEPLHHYSDSFKAQARSHTAVPSPTDPPSPGCIVVYETNEFQRHALELLTEAELDQLYDLLTLPAPLGREVGAPFQSLQVRELDFAGATVLLVEMKGLDKVLLVDIQAQVDHPEPPPGRKSPAYRKVLERLAWVVLNGAAAYIGRKYFNSATGGPTCVGGPRVAAVGRFHGEGGRKVLLRLVMFGTSAPSTLTYFRTSPSWARARSRDCGSLRESGREGFLISGQRHSTGRASSFGFFIRITRLTGELRKNCRATRRA